MPKIRLLAPWTNDKGEPQAAGAVLDVSDDDARALHDRGQAALVEEEEALEKSQGNQPVQRLERDTAPGGPGKQARDEAKQDEAKQDEPKPEQDEPKKK